MATGWVPADPAKFESYGLGKYPNVVTSITLEEMAAQGTIARPSDGRPVKQAALVLCDGPKDDPHLPYGGNVSSLVALKQALYIRDQHPDSIVYVLYGDMQTPGQYEYFYKRVPGRPRRVVLSGGDPKRRRGHPRQHRPRGREHGAGGRHQDSGGSAGPLRGHDPAALDPASSGSLNLEYLQGKDLPTTKFGFADSHFICFPYETRRTGIYSAGSVRQPMDLATSSQDGTAAALKAIQSIEKSSAGAAVHPRVGDLLLP